MIGNAISAKRTEWLCLPAMAIVSFAVVLPMLMQGLPSGYDLPHHYQCVQTFVESIRSGDLYPSWSLYRNFGYGGMETRLYPPVAHYTLALFYIATNDWSVASWLALFTFTFVGCLGVYLWAREYSSSWAAVFAGSVFAFLPYHLNQIYNTFFFAEYAGTAILPFAFVFLARVCRRGRISDVIGLGVTLAILVLTHLPLTVIGGICLAVYGTMLLRRSDLVRQLSRVAAGVGLGLAGSAFFWVKVIQERDLLAKTLIYEDPWLDYRLHFLVTAFQNFEPGLQLSIYETATLFYDVMFLGAVLLAAAFSIPSWMEANERFKALRGVMIVFLLSCFLITPVSIPFWDRLSILQEVQFPWRWVAVVSITAPVIASAGLKPLLAWYGTSRRPAALIITGCLLAILTFSISQIIRQAPFIPKAEVESRIENVATEQGFTFWWTIWTRKEAFEVKDKVVVQDRVSEIKQWDATVKEFQILAGEADSARLALFYHPNWHATVNGVPVEARRDENGALLVPIEAGPARVTVRFEETMALLAARSISLCAWMFVFLAAVFGGVTSLWRLLKGYSATLPRSPSLGWRSLGARIVAVARSDRAALLLVAGAIISLLPILLLGVYNGGDLYQHAQFAATFERSILSGDPYPAWAANENLGYGALGVRFYPPLVPFLWGLLRVLSGDWHTAVWLLFATFTVAGVYGVYLWAREFLSREYAVVAGFVFLLMPYHVIEIYNASMYAEFAGCSVVTFCFMFATRVCRRASIGDVVGLAASYAVLLLTHLPTSVTGSIALLLYSLCLLKKGRILWSLVRLGAAVLIGLFASSAYWSKMVTEQAWLRNTKFWPDAHFDFRFNFLISTPWFDERNLWFFNMIFISVAVVTGAIMVQIYRRRSSGLPRSLSAVAIVFAFAMVMCTVLSRPVWSLIPVLQEIQFPWRWMAIASSAAAVLIAAGYQIMSEHGAERISRRITAAACVVAVAIISVIAIDFQLMRIPSRDFDGWTTEQMDHVGAEWFWTTATRPEAFKIKERVLAGERHASITNWEPLDREFTVEPGDAANVRVATLFYPHWRAEVNGIAVQPEADENGVLLIPTPGERSAVRLSFVEPGYVQTAKYLSVLTWMFLLGTAFTLWLRARRRFRAPASLIRSRPASSVIPVEDGVIY